MKGLIIKANAEMLRMIAPFQSQEPTRYYLNGVCFEKPEGLPGVIMTATDGHSLASIHDPKGDIKGAKSAIVPVEGFLLRSLKEKVAAEFYHEDEISYVARARKNTNDGFSFREIGQFHLYSGWNKPIDGTFPDWRRVVPALDAMQPCLGMAFNWKYIKRFFDALGRETYMEFYFTDTASPTIIRCPKVKEFLGVLMPMRWNANKAYPEWFKK